jgi:hypothetical protein
MSKRTVLWTLKAKTDLQRIFETNPRYREELLLIRPRLEECLEIDAEEVVFDEEVESDGQKSRVALEPRPPLGESENVAIGVRFVMSDESVKIYAAWIYVRPSRRRGDR